MEKVRNKNFVDLTKNVCNFICSRILDLISVVLICFLILVLMGRATEVVARVGGIELDSLKYRGATLYWEAGNPMHNEKLEVFYTVIDSLTDNARKEYSLDENSIKFYYFTDKAWEYFTSDIDVEILAYQAGGEVFLGPESVNSDQIDSNNELAVTLIHEYVHAVQSSHQDYISYYARDVGWQGNEKPEEDENFYKVLSDYSLENPLEDMAETYGYSYLCGNNLEDLSEVRLQYINEFWSVPREEYCRDFH